MKTVLDFVSLIFMSMFSVELALSVVVAFLAYLRFVARCNHFFSSVVSHFQIYGFFSSLLSRTYNYY